VISAYANMTDTTELAKALASLKLDPHNTQLATKVQEELEALKKHISSIGADTIATSANITHTEKMSRKEARMKGLELELDAAKRTIDNQCNELDAAKRTIEEQEKELEKLEEKVDVDLVEEVEELMKYNHELEADNTDLREESKEVTKENESYFLDMEFLKYKVEYLEEDKRGLTKKVKDKAVEMDDIKSKVKFLQDENKFHIQRYHNLKKSNEASQASQARAQAEPEDIEMKEVDDETPRPVCQLYLARKCKRSRNCPLGSHPPMVTDQVAQEPQLQLAK
jgi:chromosome segregation ATPase